MVIDVVVVAHLSCYHLSCMYNVCVCVCGNIYIYNIGLSEKNYYLEHKEPEGSLYGPEALFFLDGKLTSLPPSSLTHLPPCAVHVFSLFCTALYMYLREIEQPVVVLTGSRLCVPCMCVCVFRTCCSSPAHSNDSPPRRY